MLTARHKVLAYLNKTRSASAREIARALKMPAANVRHHLRVLASDGRLELTSMRGREGRGRPEKVYSLPRSAFGDNLPALVDALLAETSATVQMEVLAKRLAREAKPVSQPLPKRLNLTVEELNQMNYHAHWEAGAAGPRIVFSHCPYESIIQKHPELCWMDQALLHELLGQSADQISKIGEEQSSVCVFMLGR